MPVAYDFLSKEFDDAARAAGRRAFDEKLARPYQTPGTSR
jgi:hypothetical protein